MNRSVLSQTARPLVLCVDDEQAVLQTLERQLSRMLAEPYELEFAQSGNEALELIAAMADRSRLALVISDLHMADMPGDLLLARLAMQFPGVPQVLLTGQVDLSEGCPPGVSHCLPKPWDPQELQDTLGILLGKQALAQ